MKKVCSKAVLGLTAGIMLAVPAAAAAQMGDLSYGAYFRFRQETWDNAFDLNRADSAADSTTYARNDRDFFRLKTSLWAKMDWDKKYGVFGKLTNESKYYMDHRDIGTPGFEEFDEEELLVDNLFFSANQVAGLPVDLVMGRQDFVFKYGEGFLVMDGTPEDGSTTFFFDAVKATVTLNENTNFDLVYINNNDSDDRLTIDNAKQPPLNTSDEEGFILYGRTKMNNLNLEPYYIYKNEERSAGAAAYSSLGELDLHTFGARTVYKAGAWDARAEFAWQTGEYDLGNVDREGYGGYAYVGRIFKNVKFSPRIELGYVNLSGDDRSTANEDESFDPLFSRWPWLSELVILTEAMERGIAYTTNQVWYRARLTLALTESTGFNFWYNYLEANEKTTAETVAANAIFSHTGEDRGHLFQAQLDHKFTDKIDGYLRIEAFDPGDFYSNQDTALFVRWQLQAKF